MARFKIWRCQNACSVVSVPSTEPGIAFVDLNSIIQARIAFVDCIPWWGEGPGVVVWVQSSYGQF